MTTKTDITLLPCPFCGGEAEMDTRQGYLALGTGRLGNRIAAYCKQCDADMGVCIEDVPDITPEQVAEMWNHRAIVEVDRPTDRQIIKDALIYGIGASIDGKRIAPQELYMPDRQDRMPIDDLYVIQQLLSWAEAQICLHEETHREGLIWEICDQCGAKWADDDGGKPEFQRPQLIVEARALLSRYGSSQSTSCGCDDKSQCWEPYGDLGHDAEHAKLSSGQPAVQTQRKAKPVA